MEKLNLMRMRFNISIGFEKIMAAETVYNNCHLNQARKNIGTGRIVPYMTLRYAKT